MTENFQGKLHQEECNNQMVQKFVSVLEENLSVKNAPKLSAKYLQDKTCKIKQMQNIPLTLRTFLNHHFFNQHIFRKTQHQRWIF